MGRKTHPKQRTVRRGKNHGQRQPYTATAVVRPAGIFHGKRGFETEEIAAEALEQARTYKIARGVDPKNGHIERSYYACDQCGHFHLTSWPEGAYDQSKENRHDTRR